MAERSPDDRRAVGQRGGAIVCDQRVAARLFEWTMLKQCLHSASLSESVAVRS
jgi:hypothetical protein